MNHEPPPPLLTILMLDPIADCSTPSTQSSLIIEDASLLGIKEGCDYVTLGIYGQDLPTTTTVRVGFPYAGW